ncbi:hypothetical protein, partial [Escherichia coli]
YNKTIFYPSFVLMFFGYCKPKIKPSMVLHALYIDLCKLAHYQLARNALPATPARLRGHF